MNLAALGPEWDPWPSKQAAKQCFQASVAPGPVPTRLGSLAHLPPRLVFPLSRFETRKTQRGNSCRFWDFSFSMGQPGPSFGLSKSTLLSPVLQVKAETGDACSLFVFAFLCFVSAKRERLFSFMLGQGLRVQHHTDLEKGQLGHSC